MKILYQYLPILTTLLLLAGCGDDSSPVDGGETDTNVDSRYIIAATPQATDGVADYLLTAKSLTEGSVSTVGNGIEQDGTYRYYITNNDKFYSLLYGQGNPGAVTSYNLNTNGELEQLVDFQSETVQAFTNVGDDVLMMKIPRNSNDPTALWFQLDTQSDQFSKDGQFNTAKVAGNGEMAFFSWMTQVDDRVYMPYFTISGEGNNSFSTQYPDSAWVAVYSYPEMELQNVIKDDRTSFIGRYFTKGLSVDENGDIYAFSSAVAVDDNSNLNSTQPSAITRINEGAMQFDENYYFNIEEATGGYYITNHEYAKNGNVLGFMRSTEKRAPYTEGTRLAIINVYDQTVSWVQGMPDPADITDITGSNSYVSADGSTISVGVTTGKGSAVYNIDIDNATATKGLQVDGGTITAIHKMESTK
ncbi:MAG TPA: DUF4374 domain-containing protein [Fodinibius sp.]|nr:DUF4374 domain-containing protein [Fodinibius sp.]